MTAFNAEKRYQGQMDVPLSEKGKEALRPAPFTAEEVFVSPLLRARESAAILFPTARQIAVDAFKEIDFGAFEGRSYVEMEHDADYRAWVDGGCEGRCPGGEDRAAFCARVCAAFEKLTDKAAARGTETLVIVAHSGTLRAVMERFALPKRAFFDWNAPCGGGFLLDWNSKIWHSEKHIHFTEVLE